jgi:hypothetical protein
MRPFLDKASPKYFWLLPGSRSGQTRSRTKCLRVSPVRLSLQLRASSLRKPLFDAFCRRIGRRRYCHIRGCL